MKQEEKKQTPEEDYQALLEKRRQALRARIAQIRGEAAVSAEQKEEPAPTQQTVEPVAEQEEEVEQKNESILEEDEEKDDTKDLNVDRMSITSRKLFNILTDIRHYNHEMEAHTTILEEEDDPDLVRVKGWGDA